jgi:polyhydroxybutyrate depolymerase
MLTSRLLAVLLIGATVPGVAAEDGAELAARFQRLDRNGDGKLSAEEAKPLPVLSRLFAFADADRDGMLTIGEIRARLGRRPNRPERPLPPPPANVAQSEQTLTVDGRERTFIVQAPKEPEGELPVVFFFHGGGGGARNVALAFRDMVAQENFLAVYAQGWKNNWNDGRQGEAIAAQVENVDDVKFVRAIVDELERSHPIDRSRIFATGPSNGGIFSHYLAAKAADLFAGIAPVIGGLAEPVAHDFQPTHPVSLLVIQGDADRLVPIGGGPILGADRRGRVIATEAMLKKYLAHNEISGEPQVARLPDTDPDDGTTTEVRRFPPGKEGVRVEYYLVRGGGHTMPGSRRGQGREALVGKTSRDFRAVEVIWQFFKSCPPRK